MRTPYWVTYNQDHIPLAQMTTPHIMNAMRYLVRGTGEYGPMIRGGCSGFTNAEWLLLFRAELLRRSRAGGL
jgi:hypothetical protein